MTYSEYAYSQSLPEVPFDIEFAEVSVHLTEAGRTQIQQEIQRLYANRSAIQHDIDILGQLTPLIQPMLKEASVPDDFRYVALPFVSEEVNTFWSVQQAQAKYLNMHVNQSVDERYHLMLTTEAVLPYLNSLRQTYGNYVQALLQYIRIGAGQSVNQPTLVNSTYLLLDSNSPPLIWKIIARKLVIERESPTYRPSVSYMLYSYQHSGGQTPLLIAQKLHISAERMKPFNEWFRMGTIPTEGEYPVLIRVTADEYPTIKRADESDGKALVSRQADLGFPMLSKQQNNENGLRSSAIFYTINNRRGVQAQSCDNAITLAYYGQIDVRSLLIYNELTENDPIHPGDIYYLEPKAKRANVPFHVVQKSQTLREVSNIYGVRLESILAFNRLGLNQRVQAGRILWLQKKRPHNRPIEYQQLPTEPQKTPEVALLPDSTRKPATDSLITKAASTSGQLQVQDPISAVKEVPQPAGIDRAVKQPPVTVPPDKPPVINNQRPTPKYHTVQPGQTYYALSQVYRVNVKQLYAWNNLSERIPLKVGQQVIVGFINKVVSRPTGQTNAVIRKKPSGETWINSFIIEPQQKAIYHIVQAGQTVYRVALINKVSVADVMRWNKLTNYTLEVGQKLLILKRKR